MKKNISIFTCTIFIFIYLILSAVNAIHGISTIFCTITAIIGAFGIWFQLDRQRDLQEAEFIMEYNSRFIENPRFTAIEKKLEDYYKQRVDNLEFADDERQDLINYLVYLEALAALVFKGVLRLNIIDDLFSYRFFLAMNNPIVQKLELIEDAEYYKGCYKLYDKWHTYKIQHNHPILLVEHTLSSCPSFKKIVLSKES